MDSFFFLPIDWTVTVTTTPGHSGPGNNGNKGILHILHIPPSDRNGAVPSDVV